MMPFNSWLAAGVIVLVAGAAGAEPRSGALSGARIATDMLERVHGCHHTCRWDSGGLHYHGPLCGRHACFIQHRPPRSKSEAK
jgi:hypothetical protein